jgi:hypothetical protein
VTRAVSSPRRERGPVGWSCRRGTATMKPRNRGRRSRFAVVSDEGGSHVRRPPSHDG